MDETLKKSEARKTAAGSGGGGGGGGEQSMNARLEVFTAKDA